MRQDKVRDKAYQRTDDRSSVAYSGKERADNSSRQNKPKRCFHESSIILSKTYQNIITNI